MYIIPALIEEVKETPAQSTDKGIGVDFAFFTTDQANFKIDNVSGSAGQSESSPKKRGRPPKKKMADGMEVTMANEDSEVDLMPYQTNEPYINTYGETNFLLKNTIGQLDSLASDIKTDIDAIRASKTLKNKYRYLTDMSGTTSSLLSTKISAIKELNGTITQCHNLDIKRMEKMKLAANDEQNGDKQILDLYNAFVNTPVGSYGATPLGPSVQEMTLMSGVTNINRADIGGMDGGYNSYINNLTPEQNRMRMEGNPNIQTVVVFNQDTGQRYFDVIDKSTGESVPNISRPDNFLLDDTTININSMSARNTNLDQTYPLVLIGQNKNIMEY